MGQARELIEGVRQAFVGGSFERFPALLTPDAEITNPFTTVHGPAEFTALAQGFTTACSERRIEVLSIVETEDAAVAEIRVRGRHTGPLALPAGEAAPTGNEIAYDEAAVVRIRDGRIASWHSYYDALALGRQLGLAPAG